MASFKTLFLAAAVALFPAAVLAGEHQPAPLRGKGRLSNLGFSVEASSELPYDNHFTAEEATDHPSLIVDWNPDLPPDEIEEINQWIQNSMQKRSLGKRDPGHKYVASHNISSSMYSVVDTADMPDDMILDIMDRHEARSVERNLKVHASTTLAQLNAPDGLVRMSNPQPGGSQYIFDKSAGQGITIYIIDTGINIDHTEFTGRAKWGANFVPNSPDEDENGHGTHCAGTAAGSTFGVAKNADLVAVKVLDAQGSGSFSNIISGMEWVSKQIESNGQAGKTVVSMSLGGSAASSINNAAADLVNAGAVVSVAAGNDDVDANLSSPASATAVITVGAIDSKDDTKASFSNFGKDVDIFAPGVDVLSAFIGSNIATKTLSGTSMACPHIAGLCAYLMSLEGLSGTDQVLARIQDLATATGAQVKNNNPDTIGLIANNGL